MVEMLIESGHKLSIEGGKLKVIDPTNKDITERINVQQRRELLQEIVQATGMEAYKFTDYSTGRQPEWNTDRVTLNFIHILTGEHACIHFNASLRRQRNAKGKTKQTVTFR